MSGLIFRILIGSAVAFTAHAQQKSPPAAAAGSEHRMDDAIRMCIGCHGIPGYKTAYPLVYHVPKLGGQSAVYLSNALNAYKSGQRIHPSMRGIAASLTDKDIADLAAYYAAGH